MKRAIMRIVKAGLLTLLLGHAIPSFGQAGITAPGNFAGALMGASVPTYVAGQEYLNATAGYRVWLKLILRREGERKQQVDQPTGATENGAYRGGNGVKVSNPPARVRQKGTRRI